MTMNQKERFFAKQRKESKFLKEAYPYVMAIIKAHDKGGNEMFGSARYDDGIYFTWQGKNTSVNWLDCEPEQADRLVAFIDSIKKHSKDILKEDSSMTEEAAVYDAMDQMVNEQHFDSLDEMNEKYELYGEGYRFYHGIVNDYEAPDVDYKEMFMTLLESTHGSSVEPIKADEFKKLAEYYAVRREISQNMKKCQNSKKDYEAKNGQITDKYEINQVYTNLKTMEQKIERLINLTSDLNREDTKYVLSESNYKKYFEAKAKFETAIAGMSAEEIEEKKYSSSAWQDMNRLEYAVKPTEVFGSLIEERRSIMKELVDLKAEIEPIIDSLGPQYREIQKQEESIEKAGDNLEALFGGKATEKNIETNKTKAGDNLGGLFNAQSEKGKAMSSTQKSVD